MAYRPHTGPGIRRPVPLMPEYAPKFPPIREVPELSEPDDLDDIDAFNDGEFFDSEQYN